MKEYIVNTGFATAFALSLYLISLLSVTLALLMGCAIALAIIITAVKNI